MAPQPPPSTPTSQTSPANVSTPSPGNWKHPKFDEIIQRKDAATFDNSNIQKIAWNLTALLFLWSDKTLPHEMYGAAPNIARLSTKLRQMRDTAQDITLFHTSVLGTHSANLESSIHLEYLRCIYALVADTGQP